MASNVIGAPPGARTRSAGRLSPNRMRRGYAALRQKARPRRPSWRAGRPSRRGRARPRTITRSNPPRSRLNCREIVSAPALSSDSIRPTVNRSPFGAVRRTVNGSAPHRSGGTPFTITIARSMIDGETSVIAAPPPPAPAVGSSRPMYTWSWGSANSTLLTNRRNSSSAVCCFRVATSARSSKRGRAPRHHRAPSQARDRERCRRHHGRRPADPSRRAGRVPNARGVAHARHHVVLELGGRIGGRGRERQRRRRALQVARLLAARGAPRRWRSTAVASRIEQDAERVLREPVANAGAVHTSSLPSFALRTLIIAARSRVLTVPSGMPSASAISRAVSPRK